MECGCGQSPSVCLVARGKHPASIGYKSAGGVATDEEYHHRYDSSALSIVKLICILYSNASSQQQPLTLQRSHSHIFLPQDEDSNSSWTSTGSTGRKRARHGHSAGHTPFKAHGSCGPSRDGSSDSEEEGTEKRTKVSESIFCKLWWMYVNFITLPFPPLSASILSLPFLLPPSHFHLVLVS